MLISLTTHFFLFIGTSRSLISRYTYIADSECAIKKIRVQLPLRCYLLLVQQVALMTVKLACQKEVLYYLSLLLTNGIWLEIRYRVVDKLAMLVLLEHLHVELVAVT